MLDVALEVPLRAFTFGRCWQRGDPGDAGIEVLGDPLDRAPLARRVTPFEDHDDALPLRAHPLLELDEFRLQANQFFLVETPRQPFGSRGLDLTGRGLRLAVLVRHRRSSLLLGMDVPGKRQVILADISRPGQPSGTSRSSSAVSSRQARREAVPRDREPHGRCPASGHEPHPAEDPRRRMLIVSASSRLAGRGAPGDRSQTPRARLAGAAATEDPQARTALIGSAHAARARPPIGAPRDGLSAAGGQRPAANRAARAQNGLSARAPVSQHVRAAASRPGFPPLSWSVPARAACCDAHRTAAPRS